MKRFTLLLVILTLLPFIHSSRVARAETLPPADWYAVVWNRNADQLFWINAQGSQAHIDRPQLPNEKPDGFKQVDFSRNGKSMVIVAEQISGQYGLGFYDLETNQFNVIHQAAPGEIVGQGKLMSTPSSDRMAYPFYNPQTQAWRIVDFTLPDGNGTHQLTSADANAPQIQPGQVPFLVLYDTDQGTNQPVVHFQFKNVSPNEVNPTYSWYPDADVPTVANNSVFTHNEFDIKWPDNQIIYGLVHPDHGFVQTEDDLVPANMLATKIGEGSPQQVHLDSSHILRTPVWLNGGQWIGFRVTADQALQPHWQIKDLTGESQPDVVALGPNFDYVFGTPDGYIAVDTTAGQIYHNTEFMIEAFSTEVGNNIFTWPVPQQVDVVYVTPIGSQFQLGAVGDPQAAVGGPDDIQQPDQAECSDVLPTRLTVNAGARVTFTDGTPLNLRDAAAGNKIGELPEGTALSVIGEPVCLDGYRWYPVLVGDSINGWAAEVGTGDYFLEPLAQLDLNAQPTTVPPRAIPTATPARVGSNPTPTPTPGLAIIVQCVNAPPSYLTVGDTAVVKQLDGTLAVREEPGAPFPFEQLVPGTYITIIGGPQCGSGGLRMWEVRFMADGNTLTGWVADGFNQTQYLSVTP